MTVKTMYCIRCLELITLSCSTWYLLFSFITCIGCSLRCGSGVVGRPNIGAFGICEGGFIGDPHVGVGLVGICGNGIVGANERKVNCGRWVSENLWCGSIAEFSDVGFNGLSFTFFKCIRCGKWTDAELSWVGSCNVSSVGSWVCCEGKWDTLIDNLCAFLSRKHIRVCAAIHC